MRTVTAAQMEELDRRTIEEHGTPGEVLMNRAGRSVADHVEALASDCEIEESRVLLVAGKGNNGGDAFVAAIYLHEAGWEVEVAVAAPLDEVTGDARLFLERMQESGIEAKSLTEASQWDDLCAHGAPSIVVDGILGTGISGAPRGVAAAAIRRVNELSKGARVLAIDLPSGLNADTGEAEGDAVTAEVTVTMGLPKQGFLRAPALPYIGCLEVVDIGIPASCVTELGEAEGATLIADEDVRACLPRRQKEAHKGTFGHVLLMGGARGYTGAISMAARAAARTGAGLVSVFTPDSVAGTVAGSTPEIMVRGWPETEIGSLAASAWSALKTDLDRYDALLVGPGLTQHSESLVLLRQIIRDCSIPLVLDADAINVLSGQPHWIERAECPVVFTPHPGELATLFGQEIAQVQEDRIGVAQAAAKFTEATVVLKGAGTVVADREHGVAVNLTGNPGMATGGTGDVLAGMIVALLGQGLSPFDAARTAVYLHGKAGDIAAREKTEVALIAGDVIEAVPYALKATGIR